MISFIKHVCSCLELVKQISTLVLWKSSPQTEVHVIRIGAVAGITVSAVTLEVNPLRDNLSTLE